MLGFTGARKDLHTHTANALVAFARGVNQQHPILNCCLEWECLMRMVCETEVGKLRT